MPTVKDVAAYVLNEAGPMTAMKLQKMVYYSKAWHLVWEERSLFPEPIQAWANGPVCPELYQQHRGQFRVSPGDINGDPDALADFEKESIDVVLQFYRDFTAVELSDLTHSEDPWKDARKGLAPGERCQNVISEAAMAEFYEALAASAEV
ncbi:Panacea domain-containing protein [Corynebacterium heidelbergense]|uniref:Antitoxin SocA-like Panacea domain-containing protein n=1 Tax=Corynebacterium heidelbergense TaxID=2055947 RepID=A0A364V9C3_9CORY|nr:type II toxin-antitoxin system antitoxin SocA domain-containing protein [Corynebacterium heidelbergense]RAV33214.1 hypothetical protein CWC39_09700 [Corynebacterium heidelbergense]WCZ36990.1 hypothetical protein CHEID_07285 [Corynebacterium heidelbergense]